MSLSQEEGMEMWRHTTTRHSNIYFAPCDKSTFYIFHEKSVRNEWVERNEIKSVMQMKADDPLPPVLHL